MSEADLSDTSGLHCHSVCGISYFTQTLYTKYNADYIYAHNCDRF